jgi:hypothetical protein
MSRHHLQTAAYIYILQIDHPLINFGYLLFEAQQAHYYDLPENLALGAMTTQPAQVIGLDHRIGYIKGGSLHHKGTAEWFTKGPVFTDWKESGSLLSTETVCPLFLCPFTLC